MTLGNDKVRVVCPFCHGNGEILLYDVVKLIVKKINVEVSCHNNISYQCDKFNRQYGGIYYEKDLFDTEEEAEILSKQKNEEIRTLNEKR